MVQPFYVVSALYESLCCDISFPTRGITQEMAKVGIFIGSIVAGLLGAVVLTLAYQIRKMRGKI